MKKIIAGEAVMSYRFDCYRLYRIWAIILRDIREVRFISWITRERDGNRKKIRSSFSFSHLQDELFTGLETTLVSNPK